VTSIATRLVARALLGPTLIVAVALLVKGYADVGDGFAAGIVAALGVLLQYLAFGREKVREALPVHLAPFVALAGLAVAFAVFGVPLLFGDAPLESWPAPGDKPVHIGSLELITPFAFDVGVFLLVLGAAVSLIDVLVEAGESSE
jgi:multisubunit Na+/H+ antiporter MnhB subunit